MRRWLFDMGLGRVICPEVQPCEFWNMPEAVGVVLIAIVLLSMEIMFVIGLKIVEYVTTVRARRLDALHRRG
jgi:hypothetical protein